jgi:hypothetical protein
LGISGFQIGEFTFHSLYVSYAAIKSRMFGKMNGISEGEEILQECHSYWRVKIPGHPEYVLRDGFIQEIYGYELEVPV